MTHEDAFLQAILAEPDDDAPRLIFADWLEERGDSRGPFIRIQCALARLEAGDPARPDLEDEERALLERHEEEWTAPLRGVALKWRFRRGFVEEITSSATALLSSTSAFRSFPIQKVRIDGLSGFVGATADSPHLAQVRMLDVSGCGMRDGDAETLLASPHLTRLTSLDLSGNALENRAVRTLAASPLMNRLNWLNLGENYALGLTSARALATAPGAALRYLGLSNTNIGLTGLRDLLNSTSLTGLTTLHAANIGRYGLAGVPAADLAQARMLSRLTGLSLGGYTAPGGLAILLRSPALARLTSLNLRDCQIGDEGTRALAESPHLCRLAELDLDRNAVGPAAANALAASSNLSGLVTLHLGHNTVRDAGARALAESPYITRLTLLDLGKNGIGGPGLRAMAESPNLAHLTTLDLSENYVGLESVQALAASPHLGRLTSLRLARNRLEPAAARALAGSSHLKRVALLDLDDNALGDEGLRTLLHSPHLTRLTELHVRHNGIGAAGADVVAAILADAPCWPHLRILDLKGNPLSGHEQRLLQQRFGERVEL